MRDSITLVLDAPVDYPGQDTLTELVIRPYKGRDLLECGLPFSTKFDKQGNGTVAADMPAVILLLARMAAVPPPMIQEMSAFDLNMAIEVLKGFFYVRTPPTS